MNWDNCVNSVDKSDYRVFYTASVNLMLWRSCFTWYRVLRNMHFQVSELESYSIFYNLSLGEYGVRMVK